MHQRDLFDGRHCVSERPDFREKHELVQTLEFGGSPQPRRNSRPRRVEACVVALGVEVHQTQSQHAGLEVGGRQLARQVLVEEVQDREVLFCLGEIAHEEVETGRQLEEATRLGQDTLAGLDLGRVEGEETPRHVVQLFSKPFARRRAC